MAVQAGVVQIFDRVMSELSLKIKRLDIDQTELACLKAIIVFNPGLCLALMPGITISSE